MRGWLPLLVLSSAVLAGCSIYAAHYLYVRFFKPPETVQGL